MWVLECAVGIPSSRRRKRLRTSEGNTARLESFGERSFRSAFGLPQHPDEHRPERAILLAVDQELGECARRPIPVGEAGVARLKSALATEPLPSGIHEQREHHQPRDNRYVNRDYLPRPQQFVHADLCPHGDKTPHGERDNERRRVARINLFIVPPSRRLLSYPPSLSRNIPTSTARSVRSSSQSIRSSAKARLSG
jgi:hypothetical protein